MASNSNSGIGTPPVDLDGLRNANKVQTPRIGQTRDPILAAKTAKEFEAMFIGQILQPIFASANKTDGMFGGGKGEAAFKSMLVDEYGRVLANRGSLGIAPMIQREILKQQELQDQRATLNRQAATPVTAPAPTAAAYDKTKTMTEESGT